MTGEIADAVYDLSFDLIFRASYGADRAAFLRRASKAGAYLTALSGTTAFASALGSSKIFGALAGAVTTAIAAADLVFDPIALAYKHEAKVARITALRAELALATDLDAVRAIATRLMGLETVEAGTFHAVSAIAWNATYLALSAKPNRRALFVVSRPDRALRHVLRFDADRFRSLEDLDGGGA